MESKAELLVVTGMSGAGRSTVGNALEDQGWYVVDNLPPQMLEPISDLITSTKANFPRLAVVVDVRGGEFFNSLTSNLKRLRDLGTNLRILFLEASDSTLVKRFESVRRPHPLQGSGLISDAIAEERRELLDLREMADLVVDTSDLNVHQLSQRVSEGFGSGVDLLRVNVLSFGFKYGLPPDADMVFDMRFLPNPHWDETLRAKSGNDPEVSAYVLGQPLSGEFLDSILRSVRLVFSGYRQENKKYVTIAIGCTGGKHRSVAMANELSRRLQASEPTELLVITRHRDLGRE